MQLSPISPRGGGGAVGSGENGQEPRLEEQLIVHNIYNAQQQQQLLAQQLISQQMLTQQQQHQQLI